MNEPHILVVDDDPALQRFVSANLKARNYKVTIVGNGEEALQVAERETIDLVILDIKMPRLDGVEVVRRMREWSQVPIIMLSGRGDEKAKVECLDLGADDYVTKPFGVAELLARVKAALRHSRASKTDPNQPTLDCGDITINFAMRRVTVRGKQVELTPTEYSVLQQLAVNAGKVLTHSMLLQKVWGEPYYSEREYLRVFIGRLRKKLEPNPQDPKYILTDSRVGYHLEVPSGSDDQEGHTLEK